MWRIRIRFWTKFQNIFSKKLNTKLEKIRFKSKQNPHRSGFFSTKKLFFKIILKLFGLFYILFHAGVGIPLDDVDGRLPTTLKPYHYNLVIHANIYLVSPPFPFDGRVEIYFECVTPTDVITINSYGEFLQDIFSLE